MLSYIVCYVFDKQSFNFRHYVRTRFFLWDSPITHEITFVPDSQSRAENSLAAVGSIPMTVKIYETEPSVPV